MLPRADVSTGALAGALIGLLMAAITAAQGTPVEVSAVAAFAVVIVQFGVEYAVPRLKAEAGAIAGALVVVGVGVYSLARKMPLDTAAFTAAATYLVTLVLTYVLPPRQP